MYHLLNDEQLERAWSFKTGDWYEKVEGDDWLECGLCRVKPRIWCFNNGSFATCLCYDMYKERPVRTESILSVYKRTGLTAEYTRDNLRLTWNLFAKDGVDRNKLEKGRW